MCVVTSYSIINIASIKGVWSSWFQSIMCRIKNRHDLVTYREDIGGYLVLVPLVASIMLLKESVDTEN